MKKLIRIIASLALVVAFGIIAVGCAPFGIDKAEDKMEDLGYFVIEKDYDKDENETIAGYINATKLETGNVTATLYRKAEDAKEAFEELGADKDSKTVKLVGRWLIVGSEDAVEDFLS